MKIEHIALWTSDLERLKSFYENFFGAASGNKYTNPNTGFSSYFLSFDSGARLEIMTQTGLATPANSSAPQTGLTHFAISVGSQQAVEELTAQIEQVGYQVVSQPRTTGDGYFESVVADPDGNLVEITI